MDLAASQSSFPIMKLVRFILLIPGIFLVSWVIFQHYSIDDARMVGISSEILVEWKALRNIVYAVYIIIFIVVGVVMQVRNFFSNQTISLTNFKYYAVTGIVFVTFSYAIAGLIIDIVTLLTFI